LNGKWNVVRNTNPAMCLAETVIHPVKMTERMIRRDGY
jgi:hypothetical protein